MVMFQMIKQALDFNKKAVECAFDTAETIQNQAEKLVGDTLDRSPWFPESGRDTIDTLSNQFKSVQHQFRKNTEEYYKNLNNLLD